MTGSVSKSILKIINGDAENCQQTTNIQKRGNTLYAIAIF